MRSTPAAVVRRLPAESRTDALLVEVLDRLARIEQLLERERGPRDEADRALLVAIAAAMRDHTFTSGQLIAHAAADMDLRDALDHADIVNFRELGHWLSRLQGLAIGGVTITRVDAHRRAWRCALCAL